MAPAAAFRSWTFASLRGALVKSRVYGGLLHDLGLQLLEYVPTVLIGPPSSERAV
jgi:hypothetical protein